jgi:hypothetical protein
MVGEGLCQNFQLTMNSRRDIERAINELKVVGTLGDTLEFGFGMRMWCGLWRSQKGVVYALLSVPLSKSATQMVRIFSQTRTNLLLGNRFGLLSCLRCLGRKAGAWIPLCRDHST